MQTLLKLLPVATTCLLLAACGTRSSSDTTSESTQSSVSSKQSSSASSAKTAADESTAAFKAHILDTGKMTFHITRTMVQREADDDDSELLLYMTVTNNSNEAIRPAAEFADYAAFTQDNQGHTIHLDFSGDDGDFDDDTDSDADDSSLDKLEDAWERVLPAGKSIQTVCTVETENNNAVTATVTQPGSTHELGKQVFQLN